MQGKVGVFHAAGGNGMREPAKTRVPEPRRSGQSLALIQPQEMTT
jgi:hypothetical protein